MRISDWSSDVCSSDLRVAELVEKGEIVPETSQRLDKAVDMITTREAIEQERRILKAMDTGAGEARPLMTADVAATRLAELAAPRELNHQQLAAAIQIVSSPDRIVLVQGRAGAGKSTMLQPIAKAEAIDARSEEHTSELQSLMRTSYAVFCLKKKNKHINTTTQTQTHNTTPRNNATNNIIRHANIT